MVEKILDTALYAAEMHKFQTRKSDESSYICHPLAVAKIIYECGITDLNILQASILHDVVEDTTATIKDIRDKFGEDVANYVYEVTDDRFLSRVERKKMQIEHAKVISDGAKIIKCADAYHNLSDLLKSPPPSWSEDRIRGYFIWKRVVTNYLKGINTNIDKKLDDLFNEALPSLEDMDLDAELEEYYNLLS